MNKNGRYADFRVVNREIVPSHRTTYKKVNLTLSLDENVMKIVFFLQLTVLYSNLLITSRLKADSSRNISSQKPQSLLVHIAAIDMLNLSKTSLAIQE